MENIRNGPDFKNNVLYPYPIAFIADLNTKKVNLGNYKMRLEIAEAKEKIVQDAAADGTLDGAETRTPDAAGAGATPGTCDPPKE